jgi:hypothetical protein
MLYVKDFARMREFYGNLLQAQPINAEWTDTWAPFDVGGTGFALHAIPGEPAGKRELSPPPPKREQSPVKLIFAVEDLSARTRAVGSNGHHCVAANPGRNPPSHVIASIRKAISFRSQLALVYRICSAVGDFARRGRYFSAAI